MTWNNFSLFFSLVWFFFLQTQDPDKGGGRQKLFSRLMDSCFYTWYVPPQALWDEGRSDWMISICFPCSSWFVVVIVVVCFCIWLSADYCTCKSNKVTESCCFTFNASVLKKHLNTPLNKWQPKQTDRKIKQNKTFYHQLSHSKGHHPLSL